MRLATYPSSSVPRTPPRGTYVVRHVLVPLRPGGAMRGELKQQEIHAASQLPSRGRVQV